MCNYWSVYFQTVTPFSQYIPNTDLVITVYLEDHSLIGAVSKAALGTVSLQETVNGASLVRILGGLSNF